MGNSSRSWLLPDAIVSWAAHVEALRWTEIVGVFELIGSASIGMSP